MPGPTKRVGEHRFTYEDESQNEQLFPQLTEKLEPMSEVDDHYIKAETLLPRGDEMARDHIVVQTPVET